MAAVTLIISLLSIVITCIRCGKIKLNRSELTPGTIVRCIDLKAETRNNSIVQQRARMMSSSFGIIMDPPIRISSKNATEARCRWIGNDSITLGINPRYLLPFRKLFIHNLHYDADNAVSRAALFKTLNKASNKRVFLPCYQKQLKRVARSNLQLKYPYLPDSLTTDQMITFECVFWWLFPARNRNSTYRPVHVINQHSKRNNLFSLKNLIYASQFLPFESQCLSKIINKRTVIYRSWERTIIPERGTPIPDDISEFVLASMLEKARCDVIKLTNDTIGLAESMHTLVTKMGPLAAMINNLTKSFVYLTA